MELDTHEAGKVSRGAGAGWVDTLSVAPTAAVWRVVPPAHAPRRPFHGPPAPPVSGVCCVPLGVPAPGRACSHHQGKPQQCVAPLATHAPNPPHPTLPRPQLAQGLGRVEALAGQGGALAGGCRDSRSRCLRLQQGEGAGGEVRRRPMPVLWGTHQHSTMLAGAVGCSTSPWSSVGPARPAQHLAPPCLTSLCTFRTRMASGWAARLAARPAVPPTTPRRAPSLAGSASRWGRMGVLPGEGPPLKRRARVGKVPCLSTIAGTLGSSFPCQTSKPWQTAPR